MWSDLPPSSTEQPRSSYSPTGDRSWELTESLPTRLDVYGGATRIWWPQVDESSEPRSHPLLVAHDRSESDDIIEQVVTELERHGAIAPRPSNSPKVGTELGGVVSAIRRSGAELTLTGGIRAFATRDQLCNAGLEPNRVVRVGQAVRVAVERNSPSRRARSGQPPRVSARSVAACRRGIRGRDGGGRRRRRAPQGWRLRDVATWSARAPTPRADQPRLGVSPRGSPCGWRAHRRLHRGAGPPRLAGPSSPGSTSPTIRNRSSRSRSSPMARRGFLRCWRSPRDR